MADILMAAIEAHGGMDRWRAVRAIDVRFNYSGAVLPMKGFPYHLQPVCSVDIPGRRAIFQGLGADRDECWVFTPDRCWIERRDGSVIEARDNPRAHFTDVDILTTKWDALDLTYFIGYAMWNYLTFPFLFTEPGFEVRELVPHSENGETWQRLEVTFPDTVPYHTKVQTFYFGDDGLIRRIDYSTDILGGVAAHYCFDHQTFNGIVIPTLRRVVPRTDDSAKVTGRTGFLLDYIDVEVRS